MVLIKREVSFVTAILFSLGQFNFVLSIDCNNGKSIDLSTPNMTVIAKELQSQPGFEGTTQKGESGHDAIFSLLKLNCTASFPVEWEFDTHPSTVEDNGNWNATYFRLTPNIFEESSEGFMTILTLTNISTSQLRRINARCVSANNANTLDNECNGAINVIDILEVGFGHESGNKSSGKSTCNPNLIEMWFDDQSQLFYCDSKNESWSSKLTYRFCANPTECGLTTKSECWEHGHPMGNSSSSKKYCSSGNKHDLNKTSSCSTLNAGSRSTFPVPKVISCYVDTIKETDGNLKSLVKMMGYFHSVKEEDGQPASSYVNWEHANPQELLHIQASKYKIMANESYEISCTASYYYFSGGMRFTVKKLSDSTFTETEMKNDRNNERESLEWWNHKSGNDIPLRRILLAEDLIFPFGDYEFTCYAPVWNSTEWTTKTVLISISKFNAPTILSGNDTTVLESTAHQNITCSAQGTPLPNISWTYKTDEHVTIGLSGAKGKAGSTVWSVIYLPEMEETKELVVTCHAENIAGFSEKIFRIVKNGEDAVEMSTKIAAAVVLMGFILNVIVFFFCWKKLFAEIEDDDGPDQKNLHIIRFLKRLTNSEGWKISKNRIPGAGAKVNEEPCSDCRNTV